MTMINKKLEDKIWNKAVGEILEVGYDKYGHDIWYDIVSIDYKLSEEQIDSLDFGYDIFTKHLKRIINEQH